MNKVELKNKIFIEGFSTSKEMVREQIGRNKELEFRTTLYEGKTSEIPEELAKECVIQLGLCEGDQMDNGDILQEDICFGFKNYKSGFGVVDFKTAKESIQSACDKEYCIIYKTN